MEKERHAIDLVFVSHCIHYSFGDCKLNECTLDLLSGSYFSWQVDHLGKLLIHYVGFSGVLSSCSSLCVVNRRLINYLLRLVVVILVIEVWILHLLHGEVESLLLLGILLET